MSMAHWAMSKWWAPMSARPAAGVFLVVPPRREVAVNALRAELRVVAASGAGPSHRSQSVPSGACSAGRSHGRAGPPTPMRIVLILPIRPFHTYSTALRKWPPNSLRCWLPVWKIILAFVDLLDDPPALGDVMGQRLLAVDVLPGPGREDAGHRVPVVRRGDHDGVDALVLQQLAEVGVGLHALVSCRLFFLRVALLDHLRGAIAPFLDHVADGDDLDLLAAEEAAEVAPAHRADADEPEVMRSFGASAREVLTQTAGAATAAAAD